MDPQTYLRRRTRALAVTGLDHALRTATPAERPQVLARWSEVLFQRLDLEPPRYGGAEPPQ